MVVVSLSLVAAAGATAVYFAGEAQHRRDRADIIAWEARALPAARQASAVRNRLRGTMSPTEIAAARAELERDLTAVIAAPLPEVVRPAASGYAAAIQKTEAAIEAVGTSSFAEAWRKAGAAFAAAATSEQNLVCRARLPSCARP